MRLRIWLPRLAEFDVDASLACEWLGRQRQIQRRARLTLANLPDAIGIELVLHGLDCVLLDVRPPRIEGAKLAGALPGLVEERLATDVDHAHVVVGARDPSGGANAAVVDRALFARAIERFTRARRRVVSVTPRPLALPVRHDRWRVRLDDDHGSVRTGPGSGVGFGTDGSGAEPPLELRLLLAQTPHRPGTIEVEGRCDVAAWTAAFGVPVMAIGPDGEAPPVVLELLQYGFAPGIADAAAWRTTALLAALLVTVSVGGLNAHAWTLHRQEQALRERMATAVRATFPEVPVVLDPVAQMRRLVADRRPAAGGGEFLALARSVARMVRPDSIQTLDYRDGALRVTFRSDAAAPEAERTALIGAAAGMGLTSVIDGDAVRIARRDTP